MAIFSKDEARAILEKVMKFSKADACEANLNGSNGGNIRYARNTVSTAGENSDVTLVVQSNFGKKSGTATVNEFDDASLEKVVRRSEELAQLAPENPEFMGPLEQQTYGESKTYAEATAKITPEYRAQAAANSINPAAAKDVTAAGFLEDSYGFASMMNTKGLFAYNRSTNVNFTVTMRTNDGLGSGWATRDYNDVSKLDTAEASKIAIEKAVKSSTAKAIEPGKYTVILEPAAASDLLQNMLFSMGARQADEGRSFLAKKGGGTKLGEKIVDERVNIYTDPFNTEVPASPWTQDGQARKKMDILKNGVVSNMFYDRYWAEKQGVAPVPFPGNAIMEGGTASLEDMIKDTKKGILVTRFWYIRTVDPQTLLYTGLTRDGTFYIENGKIAYPVKNFRFNESPVIMLNNLETLGKQVRTDGNLIPYMKIRDFTFSSLSDAV
ncbi:MULTISPECIES: TldD/PmbA family protein [Imperialibacter]|uniref:TldD/PmbA family protein n=2 Tax=Imperialibacter TaxID=1649461 RepID=A0ABZ0IUG3_9BACT|nr:MULTISPECIES: TldD/PmbA family protein [Imperialibacter]WOK07600.1 TldD/PmbA family protein [Imperialibacter roseus]CAD5252523.1 Peptidase C69 [Imperialibacter sp. 89]CAD5260609.1 Peptidase C69 [Imperialibacter sp. 75]VVT04097.1 Peptidase C69 [Imperialibacter sp. EC-SDR9]|tara:strand:- start:5459 stop:6775 length:1317 start_codon:yes stop_codon:yes gene_type:complete